MAFRRKKALHVSHVRTPKLCANAVSPHTLHVLEDVVWRRRPPHRACVLMPARAQFEPLSSVLFSCLLGHWPCLVVRSMASLRPFRPTTSDRADEVIWTIKIFTKHLLLQVYSLCYNIVGTAKVQDYSENKVFKKVERIFLCGGEMNAMQDKQQKNRQLIKQETLQQTLW